VDPVNFLLLPKRKAREQEWRPEGGEGASYGGAVLQNEKENA
jgi:hypothetical protein